MTAYPAKSVLALALLAVAGCATIPEHDAVLEDARAAVYAAQRNPQVASYAPDQLDQAIATLHRADDIVARGGNVDEMHRLAYLAQQRATAAQETARLRTADAALSAQRTARDAQMQADLSRQQAETARAQAAAAQLRADEAQRQAAVAGVAPVGAVAVQPSLAELGAQTTSRGVVVTLNDVMFYPGGAQLTPAANYNLQKLATYLRTHPEGSVTIEGFSDHSGDSYLDQKLSEERALATQSALVAQGVDARRIVVRGYGDAYPIAGNGTAAGRQMNRRVEIVLP
jgi:outer membrane protein OmpA-like peptidoglycan-associated protein